MKILYDYQIFTLQKYGGISRYFSEMIKYFKKNNNDVEVSLYFSNNHYINNKKYINHFYFLPQYEFRGKQRLHQLLNKINSINMLKKQNYDVFHPTYYNPYFLKYTGSKPFVLTVYDMIHEKFKDNFSIESSISQNKKLLCKKATIIIAISESTKKDLIEIFDIKESKIKVVYLANSLVLNNKNINNIELPLKYILFVGSRGIYKNFNKFIRGVLKILNNDKSLSIVCVGGGVFKEDEIEIFDTLKIKDKVFQYSLDDDQLASFYKNAELFVFPSLYEGFGIPILEAFACNCPLVCSDTSSLPEIAGNGAEYFNPNNEKSIAKAIMNVLDNSKRKETLRYNGKKRLELFSWKKTAIETNKIYRSILK